MKVSVITPTRGRVELLKRCVQQFCAQTMPHKEMIIIYDNDDEETRLYCNGLEVPGVNSLEVLPMTVGEKINRGIMMAEGEVIVFMDDDDLFAEDWIMRSVEALVSARHNSYYGDAAVVGLNKVYFYKPAGDQMYQYIYPEHMPKWVAGGTFCFYKSLWERHRFDALNVGYDNNFIFSKLVRVVAHRYYGGFVAIIHKEEPGTLGNVSPKKVDGPRWQKVPKPWEGDVLKLVVLNY